MLKDTELTPIGLNDFYKQDLNLYRQHLQVANQMKLQVLAGLSGTDVQSLPNAEMTSIQQHSLGVNQGLMANEMRNQLLKQ